MKQLLKESALLVSLVACLTLFYDSGFDAAKDSKTVAAMAAVRLVTKLLDSGVLNSKGDAHE